MRCLVDECRAGGDAWVRFRCRMELAGWGFGIGGMGIVRERVEMKVGGVSDAVEGRVQSSRK